jgi:hypothetical protein
MAPADAKNPSVINLFREIARFALRIMIGKVGYFPPRVPLWGGGRYPFGRFLLYASLL